MRRTGRLARWPGVPLRALLAVALLAATAFFAHDAKPAAAHNGNTYWSATLTVQNMGSGSAFGCWNILGSPCSNAATDDDFEYAGVDHTVAGLYVGSEGTLNFTLSDDRPIPATILSKGTLHVGGAEFDFTDATFSPAKDTATWASSGLSWSAGDKVEVSLSEEAPPTGVTLSAETLAITEDGSGTFTIALTSDPGASGLSVHLEKIDMNRGGVENGHVWDHSAANISPETLMFTGGSSGDYATAQTVTVTGVSDADSRNDQFVILIGQGSTRITGPVGRSFTGVYVTVADTQPGQSSPREQERSALPSAVTLSLGRVSVSESVGSVSVTATLDAPAPPGGVSLSLSSGYDSTAVAGADFSMDASIDIPVGQRSGSAAVTITDDAVDESDETVVVDVFADAGYAVLSASATLTISDDDTAGVSVRAASPLAVDEAASVTYTVVLDSEPTADVTVTATSGDAGAVSVSPASHTFTSATWSTPKTFTVSGVADTDTNDESVAVSHSVTSDDAAYAAAVAATVSVSVTDTTQQQQQANRPPTVGSALEDMSLASGATRDVSLSGVFDDPDNDALTITTDSTDDTIANAFAFRDTLTVTAFAQGSVTITVTARDPHGNRVSDTFEVTVTAPQSTLPGIAARYDANGDGAIDGSEYQQVKNDWLSGKITQAEFLQLVRIHLRTR